MVLYMIMTVPVVASVVYGTPENMEKIVNKVSFLFIGVGIHVSQC